MPKSTTRKPTLRNGGGPPPLPSPDWPNPVPTSGPRPARRRRAAGERAFPERRPELAHETQVEMEVVERGQHGAEHLPGQHQVAQRTAAEPRARVTSAPLLHRPCIPSVTGVTDHELAVP